MASGDDSRHLSADTQTGMAHGATKNDLARASEATVSASPYLGSRLKRVSDIFVGSLGILITVLMSPLVALLIRIDSRGPILYRQTRLGVDGDHFVLIKFRTMVRDAEAAEGAVWASVDDPRVTRVGKLLRKLYIDEFPQWWNVVRGDMSVVGPRPERPEMTNIIAEQYPEFTRRLRAKPGITGLAQTEYRYTNSVGDSRHKFSYDQKYLLNASLALDFWIVLRTFRRILLRRGT